MTKDERLNQRKPKITCKLSQNFVKRSHLKFISFLCPQNCSALFAGRTSTFIICHQLFTILRICECPGSWT